MLLFLQFSFQLVLGLGLIDLVGSLRAKAEIKLQYLQFSCNLNLVLSFID